MLNHIESHTMHASGPECENDNRHEDALVNQTTFFKNHGELNSGKKDNIASTSTTDTPKSTSIQEENCSLNKYCVAFVGFIET